MPSIRFTIRHLLIVTGIVAALLYIDVYVSSRAQVLQAQLRRSPSETLTRHTESKYVPRFSHIQVNDETTFFDRLCFRRRTKVTYAKKMHDGGRTFITECWMTTFDTGAFGHNTTSELAGSVIMF